MAVDGSLPSVKGWVRRFVATVLAYGVFERACHVRMWWGFGFEFLAAPEAAENPRC